MSNGDELSRADWTFKADATVTHAAMCHDADISMAADQDRNVYLLDGRGKPTGTFRAGRPVRGLAANRRGDIFIVLAGENVIYGISPEAELDWRVELGGWVSACSLEPEGERLAAVASQGWVGFFGARGQERRVLPIGWRATCVAMAGGMPPGAIVSNDEGRLALINGDGATEWEKDLGHLIGPPAVSAAGDLVAIPAGERGLLLLTMAGEELEALELEEPVLEAALSVGGSLILVETADGRLRLMRRDGTVQWQLRLAEEPTAWAMGADCGVVIAATGTQRLCAYETGVVADEEAEQPAEDTRVRTRRRVEAALSAGPPAEEPEKEPAPAGDAEESAYLGIESALAGALDVLEEPEQGAPAGPPQPEHPRARIAWDRKVPRRLLPVRDRQFRISADGKFVAAVLRDGTALVIDGEGEPVFQQQLELPVRLAPACPERYVCVWSAAEVVVCEPAAGGARSLSLRGMPLRFFDCAPDMRLFCSVGEDDVLRGYKGAETPSWHNELDVRAEGLMVSPDGSTIVVPDSEGKYRYHNPEGLMVRKFRFRHRRAFRPLGLGRGFGVFAGPPGRLTIVDDDGEEVWSRRLFERIEGVDLLGEALAVYGEEGRCAAVSPAEDMIWEFHLPPGLRRVRLAGGFDPVAVHADGSEVVALGGRPEQPDVLWRCELGADVTALDADQALLHVAAVAGESVHMIESPELA